jgi:serine/threonine protein kinase
MSAPDEANIFWPGSKVGRYTIDETIGTGGMATVYRAHADEGGEPVALKVLHQRFASNPDNVERFVREARAASSLSHRHVIRVLDTSARGERPYLVMEYLRGETLAERLYRLGRMSTEKIAGLMLPLISAVAAAHGAGIVHRDLKPDNVILAQGEEGERPVLLDFGISKMFEGPKSRSLTQAGQVVGTPYYMAPEQIRSEELDGRADQYALGVLLYELATGIRPFRAEQSVFVLMAEILLGQPQPPAQIEASIPSAFEAVVLRAMAARREDRFADVLALGRALLPFADADTCRLWARAVGADPDEVEPHVASAPRTGGRRSPVPSSLGSTDTAIATQQILPRLPSRGGQVLRAADLKVLASLSELSDPELEAFCSVASGAVIPQDAVIFEQGTIGDSCFAIVRGTVEVSKMFQGTSMILDRLGPGTFVGQDALVERAVRSVTARAVEETLVIELGREGVQRLLGLHDQVVLRLLETIAVSGIRQLRSGTRRLAKLLEARTIGRNADGTEITASRPLEQLRAAVREWSVRIDEK